uniref:Uncharacterized protein n=1 Tax=Dendroctonus ponderosae TaxID=77166 RepID=A0AAR5PMQ6_DENPD
MANIGTIDVRDLILVFERQISNSKSDEDSSSFEFHDSGSNNSFFDVSHLNVSVSKLKDIFESKSKARNKENMNSKKRRNDGMAPRRKKPHLSTNTIFDRPIANSTLLLDVISSVELSTDAINDDLKPQSKSFEQKKSANCPAKICEENSPINIELIEDANRKNSKLYQGEYIDLSANIFHDVSKPDDIKFQKQKSLKRPMKINQQNAAPQNTDRIKNLNERRKEERNQEKFKNISIDSICDVRKPEIVKLQRNKPINRPLKIRKKYLEVDAKSIDIKNVMKTTQPRNQEQHSENIRKPPRKAKEIDKELSKDGIGYKDKQFEQLHQQLPEDKVENVDEQFAALSQELCTDEIQSAEEVFRIILQENGES